MLIRDISITPEVPLLLFTLSRMGAVLLKTFHSLGKEYRLIFRPFGAPVILFVRCRL